MTDFNKIKELVEKRNQFLAEHPEYQWLQDEIDNKLRGVKDIQRRNQIIQEMLLNTWSKIIPAGEDLNNTFKGDND